MNQTIPLQHIKYDFELAFTKYGIHTHIHTYVLHAEDPIEVDASDMWLSYDKTERAGLQREFEIFTHHSSTIPGRPCSKVALHWWQKVVQRQGNFHTPCIYSKEGRSELPKHLVYSRILIG